MEDNANMQIVRKIKTRYVFLFFLPFIWKKTKLQYEDIPSAKSAPSIKNTRTFFFTLGFITWITKRFEYESDGGNISVVISVDDGII